MHGAQSPVSAASALIVSRVAPIAASILRVANAALPHRTQFIGISMPRPTLESNFLNDQKLTFIPPHSKYRRPAENLTEWLSLS